MDPDYQQGTVFPLQTSQREEGRALWWAERGTLPEQADCEDSSRINGKTTKVSCKNSPYIENCLPWIFYMKKIFFLHFNVIYYSHR